jgi:hypothetical protein
LRTLRSLAKQSADEGTDHSIQEQIASFRAMTRSLITQPIRGRWNKLKSNRQDISQHY